MKWPISIKIGIALTVVVLISSIIAVIYRAPGPLAAGLVLLGQAIGVKVALMMSRAHMAHMDNILKSRIERAKSVAAALDQPQRDRITEAAAEVEVALNNNRAK